MDDTDKPKWRKVTYVLRFDFNTFNNEVEYEVLLSSLRLANKMGAERVMTLMDSRLVANQSME